MKLIGFTFLFYVLPVYILPGFLSNGYLGLFTTEEKGHNVKLTTHFQPNLRLRIREALTPFPRMFSWCDA
jgi:hypothetical protein